MRNTTLCYIERGEQYLMLHRVKKEHDLNHDKWVGIGGKFERDETPDECLLREAQEETGLTLTDWRCRGVVTFLSDEWEGEYNGDGLHRHAARMRRGGSRVGGQGCRTVAAVVGGRQNFLPPAGGGRAVFPAQAALSGRHARRGRAQRCAGRALKSQFMTGGDHI